MHPKFFKINLKPNSYLASVSRCGPVNPSSQTFPNINLTQAMEYFLVVWKITEKGLEKLYFFCYIFNISYK